MIVPSLRQGFTEAARHYRITLILYLANLAAAAFLAAPMAILIDNTLGRSASGLELASSFRFEAIVDFLSANRAALLVHYQTLAFGALLYAILTALLTGGAIDTLRSPPRAPFLPRFLGGCGRFAFRYLRIIPYLGVALASVYWINRGLNRLIVLVFDQSDHEVAAFWAMRGKQGLILALLLLLAAVFDLARILTAFENRTHMVGALLTSAGFVARHSGSILAIYAVLLALGLGLFAPYVLAGHAILPPGSIVLLVAFQQLLMLLRHFLRVAGFASLMARYRGATGAPAPETGEVSGTPAPAGAVAGMIALLALPALAVSAPPAEAAGPAAASRPWSPRVAAYDIEASLDPERRLVRGRETIEYRNATGALMRDLQFHLYPNAFSNTHSAYMRGMPWSDEAGRRRVERLAREQSWGSMKVSAVRLAGGADLTAQAAIDDTVMSLPLPSPVGPGESVRVEVEWETILPRTFHRMGRWGDHFDVMQWFPKLAVFSDTGWKIYPFSRYSEFFADFGTYKVTLTTPRVYVVEATGVPDAPREGPGGTRTVTYRAEDVHDFAWIADRNALVERQTYAGGPYASSPVEIIYVHQPYRRRMAPMILGAVKQGLRYYGDRLMPYPYPRIVVDDLPMGLGGGMEYPMLFTTSMAWFLPRFYTAPQEVTLHELGHQFWYGIVATNEFEEPWLDEGINTYVTRRVMEQEYPPRPGRTADGLAAYVASRVLDEGLELNLGRLRLDLDQLIGFHTTPFRPVEGGLLGYPVGPFALDLPGMGDGGFLGSKEAYASVSRDDPIVAPSWGFRPGSYTDTVYSKTDVALETIGRVIGTEALDGALREYVRRFQFTHPSSGDFFQVLRDAAARARPGLDLRPYIDQLFYGSGTLDFGVDSLRSREAAGPRGLLPAARAGEGPIDRRAGPAAGGPKTHETEVIVTRAGDVVLPVDLVVRFENGEEVRETWDARATWKRFTYERGARAERATIDPRGVYALDLDRNNNSLTLDSHEGAVAPLALHWLFWVQNTLHLASSLF
ncbi:MAG: M1 family metallopeptidase [Acidobacteria bacterium]|nr:M1 family metallopeptidase [Acidobacteriota bacterium]